MKTFRILGVATACMALLPVFISCGENDPDDPDNDDNNNVATSALHVTSVGEYSYTYDSKGRVTAVFDDEDNRALLIDYDKGKIREIDGSDENELDVKFNSNGTLKEISYSYQHGESSYSEKCKGTISYAYNKQGYLTSIQSKTTYEYYEDGEYEKGTVSNKSTLTWDEDNLTKVNDVCIEDGYTESYETSISYSQTENKYKQYPLIFLSNVCDWDTDVLAVAGLYGPGPANLPSKANFIENDYGDTYMYEETYRYELNSNDAIGREYFKNEDYEYYVDYSYDGSRAEKTNTVRKANRPTKHKLFVRHK